MLGGEIFGTSVGAGCSVKPDRIARLRADSGESSKDLKPSLWVCRCSPTWSFIQKETAKKTAFLHKKIDARNVRRQLSLHWSMRQHSSVDKQELVALVEN